jgi:hypothetical protein
LKIVWPASNGHGHRTVRVKSRPDFSCSMAVAFKGHFRFPLGLMLGPNFDHKMVLKTGKMTSSSRQLGKSPISFDAFEPQSHFVSQVGRIEPSNVTVIDLARVAQSTIYFASNR